MPRRPPPVRTPGPSLAARWTAAGLEPAALDAPLTVTTDRTGTVHLDPHCPAHAGRRRAPARAVPAAALAELPGCTRCATVAQQVATLTVARVPAATWLQVATRLGDRLAALAATEDATRIAAWVPRIARDAAWLARTPAVAGPLATAASRARADALVRRELLVDRTRLEVWARQHQLRRSFLYAPLPSGALASRLGGFDAVEAEFGRWALAAPGTPSTPAWAPVHAHWAQLATRMELGPSTLCAVDTVTSAADGFERDELAGWASAPGPARGRRRLLLEWLCPHPTPRLLPRAAVELLAALGALEGWTLAATPCTDPLAVPAVHAHLAAGRRVPSALRAAAGPIPAGPPVPVAR